MLLWGNFMLAVEFSTYRGRVAARVVLLWGWKSYVVNISSITSERVNTSRLFSVSDKLKQVAAVWYSDSSHRRRFWLFNRIRQVAPKRTSQFWLSVNAFLYPCIRTFERWGRCPPVSKVMPSMGPSLPVLHIGGSLFDYLNPDSSS